MLGNRTDAVIAALVDPSDHPGVGGCVPSICLPMSELCAKYGDVARYSTIEALIADKDTLGLPQNRSLALEVRTFLRSP